MIEFKTQTSRSTKQNRTENINLELGSGISFGVVTSGYWGNFNKKDKDYNDFVKCHKEHNEKNPLIEIEFEGGSYELTFEEELKRYLK